ncbi:MAG TPA: ferredoxin [Acidimicrobiaceae bacterium]|nr:ferredoxin [Acidimicrobiaceae bacterium]
MTEQHLRVDPVACDAFGYCAELLPELVALDEWGYPVVSDRAVPPALLDLARRAVAECPRRALSLAAGKPSVTPKRVRLASSRR